MKERDSLLEQLDHSNKESSKVRHHLDSIHVGLQTKEWYEDSVLELESLKVDKVGWEAERKSLGNFLENVVVEGFTMWWPMFSTSTK